MVRAHSCGLDGRVLGGMQVTVRAHFCSIGGRVLRGIQSGVLVQVLFWAAVWGVLFEVLVMVRADFARLMPGCSGIRGEVQNGGSLILRQTHRILHVKDVAFVFLGVLTLFGLQYI